MENRRFKKMNTINTLFGLGRIKYSASLASVIAMLLFMGLRYCQLPLAFHCLLFVLVTVWSVVTLYQNREYAIKDPKEVVVDEFLGMYIACILANSGVLYVNLLLLVAFRVLDIFKPFPFNWVDKKVKTFYGLLVDDIAIGICIGLVYLCVNYF